MTKGESVQLQMASGDSGESTIDKWSDKAESLASAMINWVDVASNKIAPENLKEADAPENIARKPILLGMWMIIVIFGFFGSWSVLAPIDSAAVAMGKIILDSNKKIIDHLEGGIVKEILVREGQSVKKDEPLLVLDETKTKAQLDLYKSQYIAARTTEARLLAERDGKEAVSFPKELIALERKSKTVATNLDSQRRLFDARRKSLDGQVDVLNQQIAQTSDEIAGLQAQIRSADRQIALLDEEIAVIEKLLKSGNAARPRLLDRQRTRAEITGNKGRNISLISRAKQSIGEAEISILNLKNEALNNVVEELKETQNTISDLEERIRASADVMNRIVIRSPINGVVTGLKVHTVGGTIQQGAELMSIVPFDDELIVEARISPQDIDIVHKDLEASVRLSAFRVRNVPPVNGTVVNVSADRFEDERSGEGYYIARIQIDPEQLSRLKEVELTPGMPAEVLIKTGSRTFFSYMANPITASFNKAFREE